MLLWLANLFASEFRALTALNYITLRSVLACATAMAFALAMGPRMIRWLLTMKIGQSVRSDGPSRAHPPWAERWC